jgi:hypothetical protein
MINTVSMVNAITAAGYACEPDFDTGIQEHEKATLKTDATTTLTLIKLNFDVDDFVMQSTQGDISSGVLFISIYGMDRSLIQTKMKSICGLGYNDERMAAHKNPPFKIGDDTTFINFYQWRLLANFDQFIDDIGSGIYMSDMAVEIRFANRI